MKTEYWCGKTSCLPALPYPSDPTFLKRVEAEACYNIRRLRNHASLAMWCGNNEILEALKYWGFDKNFPPEIYQEMFRGYDKLFHQLLPAKVKRNWMPTVSTYTAPRILPTGGVPESWGDRRQPELGAYGMAKKLSNH